MSKRTKTKKIKGEMYHFYSEYKRKDSAERISNKLRKEWYNNAKVVEIDVEGKRKYAIYNRKTEGYKRIIDYDSLSKYFK